MTTNEALALASMSREQLVARVSELTDKLERARREQLDAANELATRALTIRQRDKQITSLQADGTRLLDEARAWKRDVEGLRNALDMHPLAPMFAALPRARAKYPLGPTFLSLVSEVGEVVNVALKEGRDPVRRRAELWDVVVVAMRLAMGEEDLAGEVTPREG